MFTDATETIGFDYCVICSGCNFGPFHPTGESLWFPTIHEDSIPKGSWPHLDERFLEGRRRHILEEYGRIQKLNEKHTNVLIVGAGFIGVEWATELEYFFPNLKLAICDMLPKCLGPLPDSAASYCDKYMQKKGIKCVYGIKYAPDDPAFWQKIGFPKEGTFQYVCIGVKASNYFMPTETLSKGGPGGGGWILMDLQLSVKTRDNKRWGTDAQGYPRIYAVGDCNYGCVEPEPGPDGKVPPPSEAWPICPIPKISYPGEEEAIIACANIHRTDALVYENKELDCWGNELKLWDMHWPWGAGMFATSLGPDDACFVAAANWKKGSGIKCLWGQYSAVQKEIIEASKTDECAFGLVGRLIWHFVHHTPIHLWGKAPLWGY
jgi:hypothetical protein